MKARLIGSREIGPGTRHFEFEAIDWTPSFVPGQFLSLTQRIGGTDITRAYSIASAPDGRSFALCANLVPDGHFSPFLFGLPLGGEVSLKGPYGTFNLRKEPADSILVATGTGIAPFRSMLQAGVTDRNVTLIFGVRHEEGLLYHDEFLALNQPNFTYIPTLTRPTATWTGRTGRVQAHVLAALGDRALGERHDVDIYICGLREMVDELRANLKALGVDRRRMIYEKYD